ncbi:type I-E CRISPR-associated protein Cas5/CasD [Saccharothrix violaceirubra]|uniref:CRISPR system Cascade subunit CasD n=1 Tax=Saccharothrix violaceirubra TaxID=413306 RepID=A0A7W7WWS2_9PSEU|nr:type I-E CRISPR-associated protein Cas5/CasD [Saccharothrix violaceirubra]MBB4966287.1 CRISPR system Cascade subunit CasD [Saccharothrix violaceirubra]
MPTSLALCFDAPLQSWGVRAAGILRDTAAEPTKSGVVGLLAAALGVHRDDGPSLAPLAALHLAVRVDREGIVERDFQTAQNVPTTQGKGHRTVVSERYYLADALFLVVLEGDPALLEQIHATVDSPQWPVFFGRRAFVPARPLTIGAGPTDRPAEAVLAGHPWLEPDPDVRRAELGKADRVALRTVRDCPPGTPRAEIRRDHPLSFADGDRRHRFRHVVQGVVPLTAEMIRPTGGPTPCS